MELGSETVTIGRAEANTYTLPDTKVSSHHVRLVFENDEWRIQDIGSLNGTFVNSHRITDAVLAHGDRVLIGSTVLRFESTNAPPLHIDEPSIEEAASGVFVRSVTVDDPSSSSWRVRRTGTDTAQIDRDTRASLAESKLALIQLVSEQLVHVVDSADPMDEIMRIVVEQVGADRGFLCLLDSQGRPKPISYQGFGPGEEVRMSRTILQRVLSERSGVLLKNTNAPDAILESLADKRVTSALCAPLWIGDKIIGLLSLESTNFGRAFNEDDLDLLLVIAHQAALGIERARLAEKAEHERRARAHLGQYLDDKVAALVCREGADELMAPKEQVVTVLFCDLVSFTKMSEGLAPEALVDFIRDFLTIMTECIFSEGGTIDKYMGDAVMALFGAPIPDEESAEHAIRVALAMRDQVRSMRIPVPGKGQLRVRIGINTGPLVVGNIGSARRLEYTAIGDTVNVAARLETFARPNEICVDEVTYKRAADKFYFQELGEIDVKNREQSVIVYKVIGEK